jgi:hypothetical protein
MIALVGRLWVGVFSLVSVLSICSEQVAAQSIREFVENGNRVRETRQTVQRPVSKTEWLEQQQTVYREQFNTQWQTNYRTYLTPVTEYRQELYLANRWNPLAMPYWTYRYVPITRWEARQEPYSVPIAERTLVPEQRTVHIPQTTTQMVTDEHISRVVIGPAPGSSTISSSPPTAVARQETIGGVKQFK